MAYADAGQVKPYLYFSSGGLRGQRDRGARAPARSGSGAGCVCVCELLGSVLGMTGTDSTGRSGVSAPPVVYLPVDVDSEGNVTDFRMIRLGDGRVALLAYTALDRFVDAWGEHQSWLLFETRKIGEIHRAKPFDLKLLDVVVPEEMRPGPQEVTA